jgi:hypothetical protein
VQVADDAPGARQALAAVEERRGEVRPGGRRLLQARQQGAVFRQQFAIAGVTCSGRTASKRGRPEKSSKGLVVVMVFSKNEGRGARPSSWGWRAINQACGR